MFLSVFSVWLAVYICTYVVYACALCVPTGSMCSAPLVVGHGGAELWQLHLCQLARVSNSLTRTTREAHSKQCNVPKKPLIPFY